jgi:hypothetical protein
MHSFSRLAVTIAGLALLLSPGEARAQSPVLPLPAADQQELTKYLGAGVVGAARPSEAILDVSSYFPLQEKTFTFQITSGSKAGNTQSLGLKQARRPGGTQAWRWRFAPSLAAFVTPTADGDFVVSAVTDHDDGVIVVTTPANPLVLKGIKPGESRSFKQTVAVNYLDDPSRLYHSGSMTGAYTYVGTYRVTVPAGTFDAILVRLDWRGEIWLAHVKATTWYFFARGVGVVAMITNEDVSAFWIYNVHTTTGKVLAR